MRRAPRMRRNSPVMDSILPPPLLFFDFDNTITEGDVLDRAAEL